MERRNCVLVIDEIIKEIPISEDTKSLIDALTWNKEDASYKAPEETLQWERTAKTLETHIKEPQQDWEWKILSIWTTKSIDELKAMF